MIKSKINYTTYPWIAALVIAVASLLVYSPAINGQFSPWDDYEYVVHNEWIRGFSLYNIQHWFSFSLGNFHPFTFFSYALDYTIGGPSPIIYHTTNVLLHLVACYYVYKLINSLTDNQTVSIIAAGIFALHPAQVESVAWIAERKTLLSGLFMLLTLYRYSVGIKVSKPQTITIITFALLAMMAKATAVVIPAMLLLINLYYAKPVTKKIVLQIIMPITACSLVVGCLAIVAQKSGGFIGGEHSVSLLQQFILPGNALMLYIVHTLAPIGLVPMYPRPHDLGLQEYVLFFISIGSVAAIIYLYKKRLYKMLSIAIAFFIPLLPVSGIIPFGEALLADRYMYLSIAIAAACLAYGIVLLHKKIALLHPNITASALIVCFSLLSFYQAGIWQSDEQLFSSLLKKYPNSAVAQYSVGVIKMRKGQVDEAEYLMRKAVLNDPNNYKAWHNLATLYIRKGQAMEALEALNKCLEIKDYTKAYLSRAMLHRNNGAVELAIKDLNKTLQNQPNNENALRLMGDCYVVKKQWDTSISYYAAALAINPNNPTIYLQRGIAYFNKEAYQQAHQDLNSAISLNKNIAAAYYWRALCNTRMNISPCSDLNIAQKLGYPNASAALTQYCNH